MIQTMPISLETIEAAGYQKQGKCRFWIACVADETKPWYTVQGLVTNPTPTPMRPLHEKEVNT